MGSFLFHLPACICDDQKCLKSHLAPTEKKWRRGYYPHLGPVLLRPELKVFGSGLATLALVHVGCRN